MNSGRGQAASRALEMSSGPDRARPGGHGLQRLRRGTGLVRRASLLDRLSGAGPGGVILVCAPAGAGKTVLVRSWIEAARFQERTGWVPVERNERDAQRFWLLLIDALADAGGIVRRVDPAPNFRGEAVVEQLLADLESLQEPAVLVIDDLHELRSADALGWLEVFLAGLPSACHISLGRSASKRIREQSGRFCG